MTATNVVRCGLVSAHRTHNRTSWRRDNGQVLIRIEGLDLTAGRTYGPGPDYPDVHAEAWLHSLVIMSAATPDMTWTS